MHTLSSELAAAQYSCFPSAFLEAQWSQREMDPGELPRVASNTVHHSHQRPWRTRRWRGEREEG